MVQVDSAQPVIERLVVFEVPLEDALFLVRPLLEESLKSFPAFGIVGDAEKLLSCHPDGFLVVALRELACNDVGIDVLHSQVLLLVAAFALEGKALLLFQRLVQLKDQQEGLVSVRVTLAVEGCHAHQVHAVDQLKEVSHHVCLETFVDLLHQGVQVLVVVLDKLSQ